MEIHICLHWNVPVFSALITPSIFVDSAHWTQWPDSIAPLGLVRGMESTKGDDASKMYDTSEKPNDLDFPNTPPEDKVTIAIFHPFTNKFTIKKLPSQMCIAEILDCLAPPVPSTVPIIVEHNANRLDLTTQLGQLPAKSTLRFRHFGGVGGMDPQACLRTELLARGVPPKQVNSRVSAVVTAIGENPLRDAFLHHDPWARVKETLTTMFDFSCRMNSKTIRNKSGF